MGFRSIFLSIIIATLFLLSSCFGGSSSSSTSTTSSDGTTVSSSDLASLSTLPDLDIAQIDQAGNSSADASVSQLLLYNIDDALKTREFSRASCELRMEVEHAKKEIAHFTESMCFIKKLEKHSNFAVAEGETNYFVASYQEDSFEDEEHNQFDGEEIGTDANGSENANEITDRFRVSLKANTLTIDICSNESTVNSDPTNFQQIISMVYTVQDGNFVGSVVDSFAPEWNPNIRDKFGVSLELATDDPSKFKAGDTAILDAEFLGYWGKGRIGLRLEKNTAGNLINTVEAAFENGSADADFGSWKSQIYGKYDKDQGSSIWKAVGSHPAETVGLSFPDPYSQDEIKAAINPSTGNNWTTTDKFCWVPDSEITKSHDQTTMADWIEPANANGDCSFTEGGRGAKSVESFTFEKTDAGSIRGFVYPNAKATYYDDVVNQTFLPFETPTIEFGSTWSSCEADAGNSFTPIVMNNIGEDIFKECFAHMGDKEDEDGDIKSCFAQEHSQGAQDVFMDGFNEKCENGIELDMAAAATPGNVEDVCSCLDYTPSKCDSVQTMCEGAYNVEDCMHMVVGFGVQGDGMSWDICPDLPADAPYNGKNLTKLCASDCFALDATECANLETSCTAYNVPNMQACVDTLFGYKDNNQLGTAAGGNDDSVGNGAALCENLDFTKNVGLQSTAFCGCFGLTDSECDAAEVTCDSLIPDRCFEVLHGF